MLGVVLFGVPRREGVSTEGEDELICGAFLIG